MPQIAGACPNVLAESSQNNFHQQQQHQQQQQQHHYQRQQQHQQHQQHQGQSFGQSTQPGRCDGVPAGFPINQNTFCPCPPQMDPYLSQAPQHSTMPSNLPLGAGFPYSTQPPYNVTLPPPAPPPSSAAVTAHPSQFNYGSQPATLEQFRAYLQTPPPIFILPNNPTPVLQIPQTSQVREQSFNCPGARESCQNSPQFCCPPACIPYPYPMPMYNPFVFPSGKFRETSCCSPRRPECCTVNYSIDESSTEHRCENPNDDTVCTKINCPSAISLQALASQLLSIQGVISCAATRLVLRKIPGSNITNSMDETVERARGTIETLSQDQLLAETRNAQQINALINLHMAANPPANIIPILTTIQLKVNILKSQVEGLINRRISENQGAGAECAASLDPIILTLKSDEELRTLLATLRQKECDQRVNLNFAPYHSQRVIAESRLKNIQDKITQVEREMVRRRNAAIPRFRCQEPYATGAWHVYPGTLPTIGPFRQTTTAHPQNFKSPDPFQIELRSRKRLNLQPHVGSPETTYRRFPTLMKEAGPSTDKQPFPTTNNCSPGSEQDDDMMDNQCSCAGNKFSDDEQQLDADKKKLRQKSGESGHVLVIGVDGEVLELTPGAVIVVDNPKAQQATKKNVNFSHHAIRMNDPNLPSTSGTNKNDINNDQYRIEKNTINLCNNENLAVNSENDEKISRNVSEMKKPEIFPLFSDETSNIWQNETVQIITDMEYNENSVALCFGTLFSSEANKSGNSRREFKNGKIGKDNVNNFIMSEQNNLSELECSDDDVDYLRGFSQEHIKDCIKAKSKTETISSCVEDEPFEVHEINKIVDYSSSSSEDSFCKMICVDYHLYGFDLLLVNKCNKQFTENKNFNINDRNVIVM